MHLEIAFSTANTPVYEYLEGVTSYKNSCVNDPTKSTDERNFIVCECFILPLITNNSCSFIVDVDSLVDYGYTLLGWNLATTVF